MHVHLIGVCGSGMGALATLLVQAGHRVTGSDANLDPPVGPSLLQAGIHCTLGYDPKNLSPAPDLVIVGNVVRRDNVEASAAAAMGLSCTSMSRALTDMFLSDRKTLVVAGTHGKTTTSAMCAWLLTALGHEPGWFIGGLPKDLPTSAAIGSKRRKIVGNVAMPSPFVVEGDEYDAVYWHKQPKFLDYVDKQRGHDNDDVVIVTSIEYDHADIYPDSQAYGAAFIRLFEQMPKHGLVVCDASDAQVVSLTKQYATCNVTYYALEGDDTHNAVPTWLAACAEVTDSEQHFDVYAGGMLIGRHALRVPGKHNVRNALASMAACAEGFGAKVRDLRPALARFSGVKRRQDLLGIPCGISIYDDFAHHPTAVRETIMALRGRHPSGTLFVVFEPRSATASRNIHQREYAAAFNADSKTGTRVLLAPVGRANILTTERLDIERLAHDIGTFASAHPDVGHIIDTLVNEAARGDTIALLSNGTFGGIHAKLIDALQARALHPA